MAFLDYNGLEYFKGTIVDATLSTAGKGADAKATGELIAEQYSSSKSYKIGDFALYNGKLYRCTTAIQSPGESWTAGHWAETSYAQEEIRVFTTRKNLTNSDDLDDLVYPGQYYKDNGVSVGHGVNTNVARVVVFKTPNGNYCNSQLWFDGLNNDVYVRVRRASTIAWPDWSKLIREDSLYNYITRGQTEMGAINITSPNDDGALSNSTDNARARSEKQYSCSPGQIIKISFDASDFSGLSSFTIVYYDSSNAFLSRTIYTSNNSKVTVPANAYHFKLVTYAEGANARKRVDHFTLYSNTPIFEEYNGNVINTIIGDSMAFCYQVNGAAMTSGRLLLPPNYTVNGQKVPLVVFVHGSGNMVSWTSKMGAFSEGGTPSTYLPYMQYLCNEGFAVFDCYPWTDEKELSSPSYTDSPYSIPIHIQAYLQGVKYVCTRFNVDVDRVSILCKSQGGQLGHWAITDSPFPFKAVALFAPSAGLGGYPFFNASYNRDALTKYLNFNGTTEEINTFIENGRWDNSTVQGFALKNKDIFITLSPSAHGITNGNLDDLFSGSINATRTVPQWMLDAGAPAMPEGASALFTIANNEDYVKNGKIPSKFWAAFDDNSAPAYNSFACYQWLLNGASDTAFRQLPNGTGGHHAMDTSPDALKSSGTTALGVAYTNVPTAYVEAVEFIRSKGGY